MKKDAFIKIPGKKEGQRIPSRILEETIHRHIKNGRRNIEIEGYGQHGIGGRLWEAGKEETHIRITGQSGQRTGSLGTANTRIEVMGPASDDIGWLNAGAEIIVHGNTSNGVMNGAAQGKVYIGGSIGARGMTMTKRNPRFEPPELWVLGMAGDYFGEFMAGGIAVICGHNSEPKDQILGHRPLVGMVGGEVFVRGSVKGFSQKDAQLSPLSDEDWNWLLANLEIFLKKINKT
ncbi:MAG: pyridine nucleotide-disulfide oxidoreductase, partial [Deltaproteobacteria bacterium]